MNCEELQIKAKENWWKEQCKELEELEKKGRTDLMYQKVKSSTNKKTCRISGNTLNYPATSGIRQF